MYGHRGNLRETSQRQEDNVQREREEGKRREGGREGGKEGEGGGRKEIKTNKQTERN